MFVSKDCLFKKAGDSSKDGGAVSVQLGSLHTIVSDE
jgi:hypothetical protein